MARPLNFKGQVVAQGGEEADLARERDHHLMAARAEQIPNMVILKQISGPFASPPVII